MSETIAAISLANAPRNADELVRIPGVRFTLVRLANDLNLFANETVRQAFKAQTVAEQAAVVANALKALDAAQGVSTPQVQAPVPQVQEPPKRQPRTSQAQPPAQESPPVSVVEELAPMAVEAIPRVLEAFKSLREVVLLQNETLTLMRDELREMRAERAQERKDNLTLMGLMLTTELTMAEQVTGTHKDELVNDMVKEMGPMIDVALAAVKNLSRPIK